LVLPKLTFETYASYHIFVNSHILVIIGYRVRVIELVKGGFRVLLLLLFETDEKTWIIKGNSIKHKNNKTA